MMSQIEIFLQGRFASIEISRSLLQPTNLKTSHLEVGFDVELVTTKITQLTIGFRASKNIFPLFAQTLNTINQSCLVNKLRENKTRTREFVFTNIQKVSNFTKYATNCYQKFVYAISPEPYFKRVSFAEISLFELTLKFAQMTRRIIMHCTAYFTFSRDLTSSNWI